jgi:RNA polymerase sigma factor (TIGR02999 family)
LPNTDPGEVTRLLAAISDPSSVDPKAVNRLLPLVYDELRRLAGAYFQTERRGHTLQPTALVHEAYLKLVDQRTAGWRDRNQFFGVAAQAMRRILVDHARGRRAAKRHSGGERVPLDDVVAYLEERVEDLVTLDEALAQLARTDEQKARVVELRFFASLTVEETAEVLGLSRRTVERNWTFARAWLRGEVTRSQVRDT